MIVRRNLSSLRIIASSLAAELAQHKPQSVEVQAKIEAMARMVGLLMIRCEGCPDREENYAEMTKRIVIQRWRRNKKDVTATARSLGLGRSTLYRWLKDWGEVSQSIAAWRGILDDAIP